MDSVGLGETAPGSVRGHRRDWHRGRIHWPRPREGFQSGGYRKPATTTHCSGYASLAREELDLLTSLGVDPSRVIIGHLGDLFDAAFDAALANRGAYVQFDHVGFHEFQRDPVRAHVVSELVRMGHWEHILLSQDVCLHHHLHWRGGNGYGYLLREFVPMLRTAGITDEDVQVILIKNPARALARTN